MTSPEMSGATRILGLDPGLRLTGWGVVESDGHRLRHLANGVVRSTDTLSLAERLREIHEGLLAVIALWRPQEAAIEETFVNKNPLSTLKLGQARGVVMLAPALAGMPVAEYAPTMIKKTVVGVGHAAKEQIQAMVQVLLPGVKIAGADAADALAAAICHAHFATARRIESQASKMSAAALRVGAGQ
jgi:crossover junction endodeoxyribonuclease RuvC